MLKLLLNELKLVPKIRGMKSYKSVSKEKLLSAFFESESVESATPLSKNIFDDKRLKKIIRDFNELSDRLLKPQMKEVRKIFYDRKSPENLSTELHAKQKIKEIEETLFKLEKSLSNFKKCSFQNDLKYRNIGHKKFIQRSCTQRH